MFGKCLNVGELCVCWKLSLLEKRAHRCKRGWRVIFQQIPEHIYQSEYCSFKIVALRGCRIQLLFSYASFLCKIITPPSVLGLALKSFPVFCGWQWSSFWAGQRLLPSVSSASGPEPGPSQALRPRLLSRTEPKLILQDRVVTAG